MIRSARWLVVVGFVLIVPFAPPPLRAAPSQTMTPAAKSTPIPNTVTCESNASPIDFASSFAIPIHSTRILRFLSYLDRVSEREQRKILDAVRVRSTLGSASDFERGCRTLVALATTRAINLMTFHWTNSIGEPGDRGFSAVALALDRAIRVLATEPLVGTEALLPFQYDPGPIAVPTSVPSPCAMPDEHAHITSLARMTYPTISRLTRSTGRIKLAVHIDAEGFVESARVVKVETTGSGAAQLLDSAIFAAAETTYVPNRVACVTAGGTYGFIADFTGH